MGFLSGLGNPLSSLMGGGDSGGGGGGVSSGGIGNSDSKNDSRAYDLSTGAGDSSTVNATNQIITGGTNTLGDYGAINSAMRLAMAGVEGSNKLAGDLIATNSGLLGGALSAQADQNEQFASTIEKIKTSDVRVLIIAGLAVVGMVGFAVFRKKA